MHILRELHKVGRSLAPKAPPIPIVLSALGQVGHADHRRGLYLNPVHKRHVAALVRDHYRAERMARQMSGGRFGVNELLPLAALGTDSRNAIRTLQRMRAAITSWDAVVAARGNGLAWDYLGTKASQTTVANVWSSFTRTAGNPAAMAYNNIPGPAARSSADAGAWPLPMSLGVSQDLYLTNLGLNHATGTNIALLVDLVQAAGNISATITTSQNVTTTANLRYSNGAGLNMTLEVTTALGATAANVTLNYMDQDGNAGQSTGAIALTTSAIAGRLVPIQDGPMIRFAAGDYGVRKIDQATVSANMVAGVLAALIYKPLLLVPSLATTTFAERSTPAQIGGIRKLTDVAGGSKPCLGFFVLTSTTSTGVQSILMETVWG